MAGWGSFVARILEWRQRVRAVGAGTPRGGQAEECGAALPFHAGRRRQWSGGGDDGSRKRNEIAWGVLPRRRAAVFKEDLRVPAVGHACPLIGTNREYKYDRGQAGEQFVDDVQAGPFLLSPPL